MRISPRGSVRAMEPGEVADAKHLLNESGDSHKNGRFIGSSVHEANAFVRIRVAERGDRSGAIATHDRCNAIANAKIY